MRYLGVALAGGLGAPARYLLDGAVQRRWRRRSLAGFPFPAGTVVVNLLGCLVLGVVTGLVLHHAAPDTFGLLAGVGFCGAFTTYSTFTFEVAQLAAERRWRLAALTVVVMTGGGLAAAAAGLAVTR